MQVNFNTPSSKRTRLFACRLMTGIVCLLCVTQLAGDARGQRPLRRGLQHPLASTTVRGIPEPVRLRIIRTEDGRRWNPDLASLLSNKDARIRRQATLAAGRIGDDRAVAQLASLLRADPDTSVRAMAAFALGEIESDSGAEPLLEALGTSKDEDVRARSVEALGKIAAALPKEAEARKAVLGRTILDVLSAEWQRRESSAQVALLGLTAALRARPTGASKVVAQFLTSSEAHVRADAANTLARLGVKDATERLRPALNDQDAVVRANVARALGVAEDQTSLDVLVACGTGDSDQRVRVSAVRALASLKDKRAAGPLLNRVETLYAAYLRQRANNREHPDEASELLEIATALGTVLAGTDDARSVAWLKKFRQAESLTAPEVEIAFARIAPAEYVSGQAAGKAAVTTTTTPSWQEVGAVAQGLGEIARVTGTASGTASDTGESASGDAAKGTNAASIRTGALDRLRALIDDPATPALAMPDVLRAFAAFKSSNLGAVLRARLTAPDVMVRATAAELLGELPPGEETTNALARSLPAAMRAEMNDAALAILDALAKQKSPQGFDRIKTALGSPDHLVRRRAIMLLKESGAGDYRERLGTVATRWQETDYRRAVARQGKQVRAVVVTDKGTFVIELLPEAAPLTVHNFIELARRGFFANIAFHRVVPNFVIQGGDPRGDGNGGPGYQIRCEINEVPYERGAIGMALSGKDTGGSQWFVTHAPQPHLDGGYTVFGRVVSGMETVDRIARGDPIRRIRVTEEKPSGTPNQ